MFRYESGRNHLAINALQKILPMPNNRLPRICYNKLLELNNHETNKVKYNWTTQFKNILNSLGYDNIWNEQDKIYLSSN